MHYQNMVKSDRIFKKEIGKVVDLNVVDKDEYLTNIILKCSKKSS